MESRPLKVIPVHESLRSKLAFLYEKEYIFDKFECCFSPDSQSAAAASPEASAASRCPCQNRTYLYGRRRVDLSSSCRFLLTGSYGNNFHIFDIGGRVDTCIEASRLLPKKTRTPKGAAKPALAPAGRGALGAKVPAKKPHEDENADLPKKVLHLAWHPHQNVIAVGALSNLFIYASI